MVILTPKYERLKQKVSSVRWWHWKSTSNWRTLVVTACVQVLYYSEKVGWLLFSFDGYLYGIECSAPTAAHCSAQHPATFFVTCRRGVENEGKGMRVESSEILSLFPVTICSLPQLVSVLLWVHHLPCLVLASSSPTRMYWRRGQSKRRHRWLGCGGGNISS